MRSNELCDDVIGSNVRSALVPQEVILYPSCTQGYKRVDLRFSRSGYLSIFYCTLVPSIEGTTHGGLTKLPVGSLVNVRGFPAPRRVQSTIPDRRWDHVTKGASKSL